MTYIHIHAPQGTDKKAHTRKCPDCKKRTRMLCIYTPWYGWDSTCILCGRHWSDGEWMPLDFYRYARRDNIAAAKNKFRRTEIETDEMKRLGI